MAGRKHEGKRQLNVWVPDGLHKAGTLQAYNERMSLSDLVRRALISYVAEHAPSGSDAERAILDVLEGEREREREATPAAA